VFAYTFWPRTRPTLSRQALQPLSVTQHGGAINDRSVLIL
jgi:hypothetical protein